MTKSKEPYTYTNNHAFHPGVAIDYDVTTAIVVHHMHFWISRNKANQVNFRDDRTWMYQTIENMAAAFPYWSEAQVRRAIEKAISQGVIIKGNYNNTKYDRTCWYAFKNEEKFGILRNRKVRITKSSSQENEIGEPIQDTKTDTEKELQLEPEIPAIPCPPIPTKKLVVVPPICSLLGANEDSMSKLLKLFDEEDIIAACKVAESQGTRPSNFFGWVRDCIQGGWEVKTAPADEIPGNRKWAMENAHGKKLGPVSIEALNSHLEFVYVGAKAPDVFKYDTPNFKEVIQNHCKTLQERIRRP